MLYGVKMFGRGGIGKEQHCGICEWVYKEEKVRFAVQRSVRAIMERIRSGKLGKKVRIGVCMQNRVR